MNYIPTVVQAVAGEDFTVYAYFTDGAVRLADVKPLIKKGGVFAPLQDIQLFREQLTVMNGTVAWDITGNRDVTACLDLDPCQLYEACPVVDDPLRDISA